MLKIENVLPAAVGSMILKMQFLNQGPGGTIILQLARHWLLFFENHKIDRAVVLGRPGGMRGGAGRRYEEGQRCFGGLVVWIRHAVLLYETGGGFKGYAHSAGPDTKTKNI